MIEGGSADVVAEIAAEQEVVVGPVELYERGHVAADIGEDEVFDAVLLECHGGGHGAVFVEGECSGEPWVAAFVSAHYDVLRDAAVELTLGEGEVAFREEVLVERHIVAEKL